MGVIVLERVTVDRFQNDSKPYTFVLNFEGDDSRTYFLTAYSESEMAGWMQAIQMARLHFSVVCEPITFVAYIVHNPY